MNVILIDSDGEFYSLLVTKWRSSVTAILGMMFILLLHNSKSYMCNTKQSPYIHTHEREREREYRKIEYIIKRWNRIQQGRVSSGDIS